MKTFAFIVVLLLAITLTGCVSLSSLQTGRTLGDNKVEGTLGVTYGKFTVTSPSLNDVKEYDDSIMDIPVFEFKGRLGVTENFDIGLNIRSSTFISANLKYQFIGNKKSFFASSLGAEFTGSLFQLWLGLEDYHVSVPLYMSIHPVEKLGLYVVARYTYAQYYKHTKYKYSKGLPIRATRNFYGHTYGMFYGNKNKIMFEVSFFNEDMGNPTLITFGYAYTLDI